MNRGAPMTATAVLLRPTSPQVRAASPAPAPVSRAVAYQRVLHQLVRRELRLLADLSTWAPADEGGRTEALTRHAELIGRVMLHHHRVERDLLWPALQRALPEDDALRDRVADWTARCARIDDMLRDLATAARQWAVARRPVRRHAPRPAPRRGGVGGRRPRRGP